MELKVTCEHALLQPATGPKGAVLLLPGGGISATGEISLHFLGQEHQVSSTKWLRLGPVSTKWLVLRTDSSLYLHSEREFSQAVGHRTSVVYRLFFFWYRKLPTGLLFVYGVPNGDWLGGGLRAIG